VLPGPRLALLVPNVPPLAIVADLLQPGQLQP
jgi:hypothetical protein